MKGTENKLKLVFSRRFTPGLRIEVGCALMGGLNHDRKKARGSQE